MRGRNCRDADGIGCGCGVSAGTHGPAIVPAVIGYVLYRARRFPIAHSGEKTHKTSRAAPMPFGLRFRSVQLYRKNPGKAFRGLKRQATNRGDQLSLGELRSPTGGLQAVLNISMVRFSLILRAFSHFLLSVVLFLNHGNR